MRIGLLGTGSWAQLAHAPALNDHPGVTFAGVWGRRPEAARALAERFGTRPYDDVTSLINDVDAIAVALPPAVQATFAERVALAGRHLLLDKPLALSVEDGLTVVEAARKTGVASVVFFTSRFTRPGREWIVEQSERGGWFTAHVNWLGALDSGGNPFANSPWRRQKGSLWDVGPHALSVLLPILGDVREIASATRGPRDTVHLVCRHEHGATSTITLSLTAPARATGATVELRGETGVTSFPQSLEDPVTALCRAVDSLLESARTGEPAPCDAAFGLRVVEILRDAEALLAD